MDKRGTIAIEEQDEETRIYMKDEDKFLDVFLLEKERTEEDVEVLKHFLLKYFQIFQDLFYNKGKEYFMKLMHKMEFKEMEWKKIIDFCKFVKYTIFSFLEEKYHFLLRGKVKVST